MRAAASDKTDRLTAAVARYHHIEQLGRNAPLAGHTAALARCAREVFSALVRLEQKHLVGFDNALQFGGPIVFHSVQEAVAPSKTGIGMHADFCDSAFDSAGQIAQAIEISEPLVFQAQARQWRARQAIERFAAGAAATALQAIREAVPSKFGARAAGACHPFTGDLVDQR